MIVTAKNKIPLLWQFAIAAPWGALRFKYMIMGAVFVFSMKKFIENPAEITFLMSIPGIVTIAVAPIVSFMSDRVWTRWGRRKVFTVPSIIGIVLSFIAMPLMPNIWGLIFAYIVYELCNDFGNSTFEVLKQEVVPPKQRGTAAAIGTWLQNAATLSFYLIALGRFDDYQYYAGFPVSGEKSLYWGAGLIILMMALVIILGVKETYQPSKLKGQRLTVKNFFGGLLNRNLWPVYLLIVGWIVANAGLGSLGALLYTEQWGFTKQEMGINVAVGTSINIFLIIIIGMYADKLPRMKSFELLLFISILIELSYYIYVEFILFNKTPSLPEVIIFGEMGSIAGIILGMLYVPLVFDYVPRNEMGTFVAGRNIVGQALRIITLNGIGLFITGYSALFLPPGGDMVRITLAELTNETVVEQRLSAIENGSVDGGKLSVETFYATNAAWDEGRAFEIRRKNADSLELKDRIDDLTTQLNSILGKKSNAEAAVERAIIAGTTDAEALADVARYGDEAAPLEKEVAALKASQKASADAFLRTIESALGPDMLKTGSQLIDASVEPATLFEFPLAGRPDKDGLRRTLDQLRLIRPDLIDLRLKNRGLEFYLEMSFVGTHTDMAFAEEAVADFQQLAESRIGDALTLPLQAGAPRQLNSIALDLMTIEDPINNYISPITKVIYGIWDWVGDPPTPQRRIWATARGLREPGITSHVGIWDQSDDRNHAIIIRALPTEGGISPSASMAESLDPAVVDKLNALLGADHPLIGSAIDLFGRSVNAAAANRITIPKPVLDTGFAPPKYDYMSGYLWMIIMSTMGLGICLLFTRRESKGLISKRGLEESEAEEKAEKAYTASHPENPEQDHETYRPGYIPHKILMVVGGLAMVSFGLVEMGPNLKLLATGEPATALASKVVKERIGGAATDLLSDAEVLEEKERFDRSFVFWNYFLFENASGEVVEFRADTGKQLEPAWPIRDADGLPTTLRVYYNPENPRQVVIPGSYSTWFLSGLLVLFGSMGTFIGAVMLYYANKPIAMPVILSKD